MPLKLKDRTARFIFGDDVFVSYARLDALPYAEQLGIRLLDKGVACRLDVLDTVPGDVVPRKIIDAIRRSGVLVVIASPAARSSVRMREEIAEFRGTGRNIIVVDIDASRHASVWADLVHGIPPLFEEAPALAAAEPSARVVDRILRSITFARRNTRVRRTLLTLLGASITVAALGFAVAAHLTAQIRTAQRSLDDTNAARLDAESKAQTASRAEQAATERAQQETARATENEGIAVSRENAILAERTLDIDPARALILARNAAMSAPTLEAERALGLVSRQQRLRFRLHHRSRVQRVALAEDGSVAVALVESSPAAGEALSLAVWDLAKARHIGRRDGYANHAPELTGDGRLIAALRNICQGGDSVTTARVAPAACLPYVEVLDSRTLTRRFIFSQEEGISCFALAAEDGSLVTGGLGGSVAVWDIRTGIRQHAIKAHDKRVTALAISPDGRWFVSVGADDKARVWSAAKRPAPIDTGERRHRLRQEAGSPPPPPPVFNPEWSAVTAQQPVARAESLQPWETWDALTSAVDRIWLNDSGVVALLARYGRGYRGHVRQVHRGGLYPDDGMTLGYGDASFYLPYSADIVLRVEAPGDAFASSLSSIRKHFPNVQLAWARSTRPIGRILTVAASRTSDRLVAVGDRRNAYVFSADPDEQFEVRGLPSVVVAAELARKGTVLAVSGPSGVVDIFDLGAPIVAIRRLRGPVAMSDQGVVLRLQENDLELESSDGDRIETLPGRGERFSRAMFSPDGRYLALI